MKTKKLISLGLVSVCALTLGAPSALAVTANTKSDVRFTQDNENVDPNKPEVVDPTKPEEKPGLVAPGEEGKGGDGKRAYNINWVSNLKFGEIKIAGSTMTAYAQPTTLNWAEENAGTLVPTGDKTVGLANFLQVTDNTGNNAGWDVTVKGSQFTELDGAGNIKVGGHQLDGAKLTLNEPQIVGVAANAALAPTALNAGTDILTSSSVPVLSAAKTKGQGTWSLTWGAEADKTTLKGITIAGQTATGKATAGVKLEVPVTAQPKADTSYRSELEWVLTTAP